MRPDMITNASNTVLRQHYYVVLGMGGTLDDLGACLVPLSLSFFLVQLCWIMN